MHQARLKFAPARLIVGSMAIGFSALGWGQQFQISASPIFDGMNPVNRAECTPLRVQVLNDGAAAKGTVHVVAGEFSMDYPVELPAKSLKRLNVYPVPGNAGTAGVFLDLRLSGDTSAASTSVRFKSVDYTSGSSFLIGLIATPPIGQRIAVRDLANLASRDELGFIRNAKWGFSGAPGDVYTTPQDAPDRPVAYSGLKVLILGNGSDKLSDGAVQAIKAWALAGGTLVFLGGASSPAALDPRWAEVLPVTGLHPVRMNNSISLTRTYGYPVDPFVAQVGKPSAANVIGDSEGLTPERPFGLGRSVYVGFDPFERPFIDWPARGKFFADLLSPALLEGSQLVLNTQQGPLEIRAALEGGAQGNNPFQAELPSTGEVATILALYFLAVVPLNFLVLRKLKRGELAWATAPVMSLGFAGIFFASAHGLYTAQLSTTTRALMLLQADEPQGLVLGRTQMYFPHAGTYDLETKGVDTISQGAGLYQDYGRAEVGLRAVDDGEAHASLSVPNLAFREVNFQQRAGSGDWFGIRRVGPGQYEVTNNSPFPLEEAGLCAKGSVTRFDTLNPGKSVVVTRPDGGPGPVDVVDVAPGLGRLLMRSGGIGIAGRLAGFRAGPQVGTEIRGSDGTNIIFVSNERIIPSDNIKNQ